MTKSRYAMICSAVFLSGAVAAVPAKAQEFTEAQTMYERYYYTDSSFTDEVGYERDRCHYYGVGGGPTQGIETAYYYSNPIAYCVNGQLYPIT